MAIRNFLLKEELENPIIGEGLVFRYLEEVFVGKADADRAEEYFVQGIVRPWF
jgi:hypothetical protein